MNMYDEAQLRDAFPGLYVKYYLTIDSTNSEARRQYEAGLQGPALFLAGRQEKGRGRHGKQFYSPADTGIYMTLLMPVNAAYEDARRATAKTAVAVCRAIRRVCGLPAGIKWVNDLYLYGRKIAGILAESVLGEGGVKALIIGIGINVTTADFPGELAEKAGALGLEVDRTALVREILRELIPEIRDLKDCSYLELYRAASVVLGKTVVFEDADGNPQEAYAAEIDGDGALAVLRADGTRETLNSGEISIRVTNMERR